MKDKEDHERARGRPPGSRSGAGKGIWRRTPGGGGFLVIFLEKFKASGMHAAPISSQRTFLRVFVRLDAHHLLMVAKKDREKLGGIGAKTLRFRISQKVQVSGRVSRLVLFQASFVWKQAAKADRAI